MTAHIEDKSPRKIARTAGLWYLLAGLPAPLSLVYIPSKLIVPGDATATANNIHASEMLFRIGIVGNLVSQIGFIFVSLALYQLLKPVHKNMAVLMVILNLIGIPITMLNELTQFVALQLLSGAHYLTAFTSDQVHALALSYGLPGLQVGFPSQNYRCLVDDWLCWLCDAKFCHISFAQPRSKHCSVNGLGRTVIHLVAVD
jgi:hypothetical protein